MVNFNNLHFKFTQGEFSKWSEVILNAGDPAIITKGDIPYLIFGDGNNTVATLIDTNKSGIINQKTILESISVMEFKGLKENLPENYEPNNGDVVLNRVYSFGQEDYVWEICDGIDWFEVGNFTDIPQANWEEESTNSRAHVLNRPSIKKGEGKDSIIIGEGQAISDGSIAGGMDEDESKALAGCKGFFYYSCTVSSLQLSLEQGKYVWSDEAQAMLEKWVPETKLNVVGSHKHTMCSTVVSIGSDGYVEVDRLPFGDTIPFDNDTDNKYKAIDWSTLANPDWDDGAVYAPELPEAGIITFGRGARSIGANTQAIGTYSVAEGKQTLAANDFGHAEGRWTKAGYASHAEGYSTLAIGQGAHSEGHGTNASAHSSHAEGNKSTASGNAAHAEGVGANAIGEGSHAEGNNTFAKGNYAHAEGLRNDNSEGAVGVASHVEGANGVAKGNYSHVEGLVCKTASGASGAHAEGEATEANAQYSHAEGWHTVTNEKCGHVQGKYNKSKTGYAHVVGNGSASAPSDAHTLDWNGNAWFAGSVTVGDKELATKEYVNKEIKNIDLTGYATETYVDKAVKNIEIPENIATKDYIDEKIENIEISGGVSTINFGIKYYDTEAKQLVSISHKLVD